MIVRSGFIILGLCTVALSVAYAAQPITQVHIRGVPTAVYFNDGDTFRINKGTLQGTRSRLAGFNTLESFGPIHRWGDWTKRELYILAKIATNFARRGMWRCHSDMRKDGYGRVLFQCPELRIEQVRRGFAHAMTVTADPAPADLLEAQAQAIEGRRGIWAHGVPEFVLTSLHSITEKPGQKTAYNRLVSSRDGHSQPWIHSDTYEDCQEVCFDEVDISSEVLQASIQAFEGDDRTQRYWRELKLKDQVHMLRMWLMIKSVAAFAPEEHRAGLKSALAALVEGGTLYPSATRLGSCMVYSDYMRRFGDTKASCLKVK